MRNYVCSIKGTGKKKKTTTTFDVNLDASDVPLAQIFSFLSNATSHYDL